MSLFSLHSNPGVRRLAKAELRRNPGRTTLIFLLAFLPALAGAYLAGARPANVQIVDEFGDAEPRPENILRFTAPSSERADQLLVAAGAIDASQWVYQDERFLAVSDKPGDESRLRGEFGPWEATTLVEGRYAQAKSEVALTQAAVDLLATSIGEVVRFGTEDLTVVGIVDMQHEEGATAYVAPGTLSEGQVYGLAEFATTAEAVAAVDQSRQFGQIFPPPDFTYNRVPEYAPIEASASAVLAFMFAAAIVGAAAWSVGFERRLRAVSLAQVGGAEVTQIRAAVSLQALLISGVAVPFAWIVFVAGSVFADNGFSVDIPTFFVHALVVIGMSMFAAWLPLAQLGNDTIGPGLSGRTDDLRTDAKRLAQGLAALFIGLVLLRATIRMDRLLLFVGLAGIAMVAAAATLLMPAILRAASGLLSARSASARLAVRSILSQWRRSVGLVLALGGIVTLVSVGLLDAEGSKHRSYGSYSAAQGYVDVQIEHPDPVRQQRLEDSLGDLGAVRNQYGYSWQLPLERLEEFEMLGPSGVLVRHHVDRASSDQQILLSVGLGVVGVVLVLLSLLTRSEDGERRSVLHHLGASSSTHRRVAWWYGLALGGVAVTAGVLMGVLIHLAVENQRPRLVVPYTHLAILAASVPLLAAVIFMATTPGARASRSNAVALNPALT